ncbi:Nucleotide-binding universal stress protein, UspA family [Halogranum amylolyticum]|uniref:Nucleotide-binding universal stress protein, UspA family n=1 Tax=Halogranum amylolyticum TaxID=660520 RepID=A0A1H8ULY7_9EURY|nr:universal stress protein [Halogranum amylolyticum]SEP03894.1 Nucleotide-binding universal stress protein, UspA family [Halogranum amylolyticum]
MYQIVVPVDDNVDRAVEQARHIIELPGDLAEVSITIAHAYRDTNRTNENHDEESPAVIAAIEHLRNAGLAVEQRELYVPVAEAILDLTADIEADAIVMGGRKRSPTGKALFGSVTQSVILDATVPVTVVGVE